MVIIACHNILTLLCIFSRLSIDSVADVTGSILVSGTCRWSNTTEERISGLVWRRSLGGALLLLLLTRLRHLGFQTCSQSFLMAFENLFGMVRALS